MVPAFIVALPALPRLPNGKLDRKSLPAPLDNTVASSSFVAPRSPLEETLAAIWAEVLGRERVGIHDDFFELGGHSLSATQVMARARRVLGLELPLRAIFEAPTIAELSQVWLAREGDGGDNEGPLLPGAAAAAGPGAATSVAAGPATRVHASDATATPGAATAGAALCPPTAPAVALPAREVLQPTTGAFPARSPPPWRRSRSSGPRPSSSICACSRTTRGTCWRASSGATSRASFR